ncbi:hypothetical protein Tco_1501029 [Tanacetum coccineum]
MEPRSTRPALSFISRSERNYNKLDALDNLEAVILVRSGEEQGRQDSLCGPWGDSQGYKSRDQEGVQKGAFSCPIRENCLEFPHAATSATRELNECIQHSS